MTYKEQHSISPRQKLCSTLSKVTTALLSWISAFEMAADLAGFEHPSTVPAAELLQLPPCCSVNNAHPSSLNALSLCSKYCLSVPSNDSTAKATSQQHGNRHAYQQQTSCYVIQLRCLSRQLPYATTAAKHANQIACQMPFDSAADGMLSFNKALQGPCIAACSRAHLVRW
jgi:hypothetical protein